MTIGTDRPLGGLLTGGGVDGNRQPTTIAVLADFAAWTTRLSFSRR